MDTHGAHPNSDVNTILWDKSESKRISIRPFFTETADNGATMLGDRFVLRACIVNFRTEADDVDAVLDVAAELGTGLDAELRPMELGGAA